MFYPTQAEWNESPLSYLERVVRPYGEITGIVKIVPPTNWRPAFCVDGAKFTFPTRQQYVNQLECQSRIRTLFGLALRKFCFKRGRPMARSKAKDEIGPNWYLLFSLVVKHGIQPSTGGNADAEDDDKQWIRLAKDMEERDLKLFVPYGGLKQAYLAVLRDFHVYLLEQQALEERADRDGSGDNDEVVVVEEEEDVQMETPVQFPNVKRIDLRTSTNKGLDGTIWGARGTEAGYRAALMGREAALAADSLVHTPQGKAKLNLGPAHALELTMEMFSTLPPKPKSGDVFWKYFPHDRACLQGQVLQCSDRKADLWKVRYGLAAGGSKPFDTEEDGGDLALAICCGVSPEEAQYAVQVGVCQVCNRAHLPDTLLVCDACEYRYHNHCLLGPDRADHNSQCDWFCPLCLDRVKPEVDEDELEEEAHLHALRTSANGGKRLSLVARAVGVKDLADFGFPDGDQFVLDDYMANDQQFRKDYGKPEAFASDEATEREFWDIVRGRVGKQVHVMYGNDIDTAALGSGFPTKSRADKWQAFKRLSVAQRQEYDSYASSPWNLNNLPTSEGSLLQLVDGNISGVIVPWLYMGMTFSAFCFHVEDHNFASINYHHRGAAKSWWGCSAGAADQFESAAKEMASELIEGRPDLMQGIVTMFHPSEMVKRGVAMYHLVQKPGEFVVTFPRAYHGGFNHGWNSAEAVNFAGRGWLGFGDQAVARYSLLHKMPVVAHESLMVSIATWCLKHSSVESFKTAHKLLRPFLQMLKQEEERRKLVGAAYQQRFGEEPRWIVSNLEEDESGGGGAGARKRLQQPPSPEAASARSMMSRLEMLTKAFKGVPQCRVCKRYCALSHGMQAGETFCLEHTDATALGVSLVSTVTLQVLRDVMDKLCVQKCTLLEHWMERATRLCKGAKQPDLALGEENSGGPPLAFSLTSVHAYRVSPEIDLTCLRVKEWKSRPSMEACRKLLQLPAVPFLEESSVLRRALDVSEQFCAKWGATTQEEDLVELEKAFQALNSLPVQVPRLVAETLTARRQAALAWRELAQAGLQTQDMDELQRLARENADTCRVTMPELVAIRAQIETWQWTCRVRAFLRAPSSWQAFTELAESKQAVPGPELDGLRDLAARSAESGRRIKAFLVQQNGASTVQAYADFASSCVGPQDLPPSGELAELQRGLQVRLHWRERASALLAGAIEDVEKVDGLVHAATSELQIAAHDETLARLLVVQARARALVLEMDRKFPGGWQAFRASSLPECAVCSLPVPFSSACAQCSKPFHPQCGGGGGQEGGLCAKCDAEQLRFCYCRTNTEDLFMTQCDECFGWFHSHCAGFPSDADMERLATFHCLACSTKLAKPYAGALPGAYSECAACRTLCVTAGEEDKQTQCRECGQVFHKVCMGLGVQREVEFCLACCEAKGVPVVPQRGHGAAVKLAEFAQRSGLVPARPEFAPISQIRSETEADFPGLFWDIQSQALQPVERWIEAANGALALAAAPGIFRALDDSLRLPLAPPSHLIDKLVAAVSG